MPPLPFIRYLIKGPGIHWWDQAGAPFLRGKAWHAIAPAEFYYESSYGFDPELNRHPNEIRKFDYCQKEATIILEYRGEPPNDSLFVPSSERTLIDDLLAFMSLYTGEYCQYLYKERSTTDGQFNASVAVQINHDRNYPDWAGPMRGAVAFFETALLSVPSLDTTQIRLAIRWFFSALTEFEIGRPIVEAALNWVCLESQANYLGLPGNKFKQVEALLQRQGFTTIPRMHDFYKLRNDAFHEGQLSNFPESDAQLARHVGRVLVRAQILNLLGMDHSEFETSFTNTYTQ